MLEKLKKIPHPGLRTIKTALAATLCIIGYTLLGRPEGLPLACIAIFIAMQDSVGKTWKVGKDRALGTLLGGTLGSLVGLIRVIDQHLAVLAAVAFVGIVLYIFACTLLKIEGSIVIGLSTYIIIVFGPQAGLEEPVWLAIDRTLDTMIGLVLGGAVNALIFRPRPERHRGHDTVNPVFHYTIQKEDHQKTIKWDGGETKELYIYPEDAIYQEERFDFRIAVNSGEIGGGQLRKFEGFKRQMMLLDGEICLMHKEQHSITLAAYEQDVALGAWDTSCEGCGREISLLTNKAFSGKIEPLSGGARIEKTNGEFVSFYCLEDGVKISLKNGTHTYKEECAKGDYLVISWFENGTETYKVTVDCEDSADEAPPVLMISCTHE